MPMEAEWLDVMPHEITWRPLSRDIDGSPIRDFFGKEQWDPPQTVRCYIAEKNRMVRTSDGTEEVSSTTIYTFGNPGIKADDQIELPDGSTPLILAVSNHDDENGDYSQEIALQ